MASDMGDNLFSTVNRDLARRYWIIIGVIITFLTFLNILNRILARLRLKASSSNHPNPTKVTTIPGQIFATTTALIREISLPSVPAFTSKNTVWSLFTPPPLGRSLVVFLYMVMIAIFLSFNVYVSGYWYYEKIAYRAAWISITQIPFVLLIGGRLSLFTLLTSIPSERINWLHRWVGRVILVSVLVHMSLFWREWDLIDFLQTELEIMPMVRYGFGAFGVLAWITITSIAPIRWFAYEIFYINHLASIGALLWCLYMHVPTSAIYNVWLGIAFIAFDRVLRAGVFLWNNIQRPAPDATAKPKYGLKFGHTAEVEILDRKEHLTRVVIKDVKMKWRAGQHIYLNIPALRPFEAHPFTISNSYEGTASHTSSKEYKELGQSVSSSNKRDLHLLIRSRFGFSKQLHKKCTPGANAPVLLTAFIDGPYGSPPVWSTFETAVLIATSTGITFILPILEELARDPACVRRIHFYWTVRHVSDLKLLTRRLARLSDKAKAKGVDVSLTICVTCGTMKEARKDDKFVIDSDDDERGSSEDSKASGDALLSKDSERRIETVDEITPVSLPDIASPSCCSNKPAPLLERSVEPKQSAATHSRTTSSTSSTSSSSFISDDGVEPTCCCSSNQSSCCETVCTCGFSSSCITFSCGRPQISKMILPAVEQAEGETIVACCANRRLMDDVRNYVGKVCDDRAVHKGTGAQGILCWTEGFY
ncbi:hypothetical protein ABW19_dt0205875 [Dactylella cylindrospora]|nr:hypothetical protein ABW19_dt0205875 [Dactylella cylindrospora]